MKINEIASNFKKLPVPVSDLHTRNRRNDLRKKHLLDLLGPSPLCPQIFVACAERIVCGFQFRSALLNPRFQVAVEFADLCLCLVMLYGNACEVCCAIDQTLMNGAGAPRLEIV